MSLFLLSTLVYESERVLYWSMGERCNEHEKATPVGVAIVIRMGLEPMTRSLEGCCSNPTELPNHP